MTVEWEGVERPLPQLQPFLKSPDRAVRERAFRAGSQPYIEKRDELAGLFNRMYELRTRAARNAGFANFRDYIFPAKFRFDYTPADCERFHEAIERIGGSGGRTGAGGPAPAARGGRAPALGSGGGPIPGQTAAGLHRRGRASHQSQAGVRAGGPGVRR